MWFTPRSRRKRGYKHLEARLVRLCGDGVRRLLRKPRLSMKHKPTPLGVGCYDREDILAWHLTKLTNMMY